MISEGTARPTRSQWMATRPRGRDRWPGRPARGGAVEALNSSLCKTSGTPVDTAAMTADHAHINPRRGAARGHSAGIAAPNHASVAASEAPAWTWLGALDSRFGSTAAKMMLTRTGQREGPKCRSR